jgi:hypothetical protein
MAEVSTWDLLRMKAKRQALEHDFWLKSLHKLIPGQERAAKTQLCLWSGVGPVSRDFSNLLYYNSCRGEETYVDFHAITSLILVRGKQQAKQRVIQSPKGVRSDPDS